MKPDELAKIKSEIADLTSAVSRFKDALDAPDDEHHFVRDSSIQRFEFCTELAWKTVKAFLSVVHATECVSPPTCMRAAFAKSPSNNPISP